MNKSSKIESKFSSDSTFQKNHIKFPLKTVINGYNFEESDSITTKQNKYGNTLT